VSRPFGTLNGVRQGGVLSPLLFSLYLDNLLADLSSVGIGCHYIGMFVGAQAYADDLTLLAPSPSALHLMLLQFGKDHGIRFNPNKTQLICFRKWGLLHLLVLRSFLLVNSLLLSSL